MTLMNADCQCILLLSFWLILSSWQHCLAVRFSLCKLVAVPFAFEFQQSQISEQIFYSFRQFRRLNHLLNHLKMYVIRNIEANLFLHLQSSFTCDIFYANFVIFMKNSSYLFLLFLEASFPFHPLSYPSGAAVQSIAT